MRKLRTISKKYDGSLRDMGEAYLVEETADRFLLLSLPKQKYWLPKKQAWFEAPDGMLELYFKQKWYNIWYICEQNSGLNQMYINIAMPPTLHEDLFEWVDLDVDYRVHLDNTIEQLDWEEFEQNKQLMSYSAHVVRRVTGACQEVEQGLAEHWGRFNHELQVEKYRQIRKKR